MIVYKNKVSKEFWKFVLEEGLKAFPSEKNKKEKIIQVELTAVSLGYKVKNL